MLGWERATSIVGTSHLLRLIGVASVSVGVVALCAGCESNPPERVELPPHEVFIAMERDFQAFRDWGSVPVTSEPSGETHLAGSNRTYVNALPVAPTDRFPAGTIMVKDAMTDAGPRRLFAMVKRGGGFNSTGAKGWEWFELEERGDGSVGIAWRGLGAPQGEEYGGDPSGTCNSCHQRAVDNDYVKSERLLLSETRRKDG